MWNWNAYNTSRIRPIVSFFNWTNVELKHIRAEPVQRIEFIFNWTNVELKPQIRVAQIRAAQIF